MSGSKTKLTVSIEASILKKAKDTARKKHISLSGVIEKFLSFFSDPYVYCFKCGERFSVEDAALCPKCGWLKCPECGSCRCSLSEEAAIAVFHMRRILEDLLSGKLK